MHFSVVTLDQSRSYQLRTCLHEGTSVTGGLWGIALTFWRPDLITNYETGKYLLIYDLARYVLEVANL